MTKICFVTKCVKNSKPEILFLSEKYSEALNFFKQHNTADGEICFFAHPAPDLVKKLKPKVENPSKVKSTLK